jgi:hypothetical protein
MAHVMVRYKVKPECAEENEALVRAVYDELHRTAPAGLEYATFVLEDGVSFMHMATHDADDNPLYQVAAFGRFQAQIRDRCEEPPVVARLREVGAFRP